MGRIGYLKTGESDTKMFHLVTQYLQKQLKQLKQKNGLPAQGSSGANQAMGGNQASSQQALNGVPGVESQRAEY